MKIGQKTILAFGLFTLMICVIGMFLHRGNREIQAQFHELKEDIVPGALAMRNKQALLQRMVMQTREYSRTGDPVYADAVRTSTDSVRESVRVHAESDMRINPDHNTVVTDIERRADEMVDLCNNLIALSDSGMANEDLFAEKDVIELKLQELNQILDSHVEEHLDELAVAEIEIQKLNSQNRFVMIGGIGLILVFALTIYFFAGRSIVAPIHKLKHGAEAIGAGRLAHRLHLNSKDEFDDLAKSFNTMADQIQESHNTLERRVEERTNELETIIESAPVGIMVIDPETRKIVRINNNTVKMTGCAADELIGKRCHEFVCMAEEDKCPILDLGQEVDNSERVLLNADGNEIPVLKSVVRIKIEGRDYLLETFSNITDQKQAEQKLKDSEEEFRSLVENAPNIILIVDRDHRIRLINNPAPGHTVEETIGRDFNEFIGPEFQDEAKAVVEKVLQTGEPGRFTSLAGPPDHRYWYETHVGPIMKDEQVDAVTLIATDITAIKEAEKELQRNAEKYQALLQTSNDGFWVSDGNGRLLEVNDSLCSLLGYTREELLSMSIPDIEEIENPEETAKHINKIIETGYDRFETRHRRKDGASIIVEVSVTNLNAHKPLMLVFVRDITKRKQDEEMLSSKMKELEEFNLAAMGRELKMIQLKDEINRLLEKQDKEAKYEIVK